MRQSGEVDGVRVAGAQRVAPCLALVQAEDAELGREISLFLRREGRFDVTSGQGDLVKPRSDDEVPGLVVIEGGRTPAGTLARLARMRGHLAGAFILYIATSGAVDEAADAFEAGADDVLRAPVSLRELRLRLRARLGRTWEEAAGDATAADGHPAPRVLLDAENCLHAEGMPQPVRLTRAEAEVMAVLIRSGGGIVSRSDLAREIDKSEWEYGDRRFDVHVANIRKKLRNVFGQRYALRSIRNEGYAFREAGQGAVEAVSMPGAVVPGDA